MKILTSAIFGVGAVMLIVHIIQELDRAGIYNDPATKAIGLMVMAGVAHMIWGEK